MRLLFTGAAPWMHSGYGKPGRYLFPRLSRAGHDIGLLAFAGYRGPTMETEVDGEPLRIYSLAKTMFFNDIVAFHVADFKADYVISLQDVWCLKDWGTRDFDWLPRIPIDTDPISDANLSAIEGAYKPLALTEWGQRQLIAHGWPNAGYIPHGIDCQVYRPQERTICREALGLPDTFIAGVVASNASLPSRKSFPEIVLAWKRWKDGGGPGLLYLHTTVTPWRDDGVDFEKLLGTLGIDWSTLDDPQPERRARATILFPAQYRMWASTYDDNDLALLYNSLDVLLSPSQAEGFGIPIVEAQACGIPVVTLATTSMPELTIAGMCLEPIQDCWEAQGGWRGIAGVDALVAAIDWAEQMTCERGRKHLCDRARAFAEDFDFDRVVADHWLPLLEELS